MNSEEGKADDGGLYGPPQLLAPTNYPPARNSDELNIVVCVGILKVCFRIQNVPFGLPILSVN